MISRVIGGLVIVAAIGYIVYQVRRWVMSQPWLVAIGRYLTGLPHHGKELTDAGWLRRGQKALTRSGHATRWWYLPRWIRTMHRCSGFALALVTVTAFLLDPLAMTVAVGFALAAALAWSGLTVHQLIVTRKDRRTWMLPIRAATHERLGINAATPASNWIDVETDVDGAVQVVRIHPPPGALADPKDQQWLISVVATTCAIEGPEVIPALHGPSPSITLKRSEPPPREVAMADVLEKALSLKATDFLIGIGKKGEPVIVSLDLDSPHLAISMGTGGGKSNLAGWILFQILMKGGIGLILDAKRGLSYPWVLKDMNKQVARLPNVLYAKTTAQLHDGMMWLSDELDRRNDVAFAGQDTRGLVHASVGPRFFTIIEELNVATPRLRAYWAENRDPSRDPTRSPAFTGMDETGSAGREVFMNEAIIGQYLTANATGRADNALKANCGIKLMARYEKSGWRSMCGDVPMPPPPEHVGRIQVVVGNRVREAQVPKLDRVRARQMVLESNMALLPSTVPSTLVTAFPPALVDGASPAVVTVSAPRPVTSGPTLVTLHEAVAHGHVGPHTTKAGLRMAMWRDKQRPKEEQMSPRPVGKRGNADMYDAEEIAMFDASRR